MGLSWVVLLPCLDWASFSCTAPRPSYPRRRGKCDSSRPSPVRAGEVRRLRGLSMAMSGPRAGQAAPAERPGPDPAPGGTGRSGPRSSVQGAKWSVRSHPLRIAMKVRERWRRHQAFAAAAAFPGSATRRERVASGVDWIERPAPSRRRWPPRSLVAARFAAAHRRSRGRLRLVRTSIAPRTRSSSASDGHLVPAPLSREPGFPTTRPTVAVGCPPRVDAGLIHRIRERDLSIPATGGLGIAVLALRPVHCSSPSCQRRATVGSP
jgi:hypothetical protein